MTSLKSQFARVVPLHFFWSQQVQLVVLVSAFVMVIIVSSVSCLLFFYSRCPRAQPFVKVGARAPFAPWRRRHWILGTVSESRCNFQPYSYLKIADTDVKYIRVFIVCEIF